MRALLQSLHRRRAGTNTNSRVRMRAIQTNRPDQNRLRCFTTPDDCVPSMRYLRQFEFGTVVMQTFGI